MTGAILVPETGLAAPRRHLYADSLEFGYAPAVEAEALLSQHRPLGDFLAAITAEASAGGDHPVTGDVRRRAGAHDVADGARRARPPGQRRHVTVGGDAAARNAAHGGQHAPRELIGDPRRPTPERHRFVSRRGAAVPLASASLSTRPSAVGSATPAIVARVGAMSAGVIACW